MRKSLLGIAGLIVSVIGVILTLYFGLVQQSPESSPSTQAKQELSQEPPPVTETKQELPPGVPPVPQATQKRLLDVDCGI